MGRIRLALGVAAFVAGSVLTVASPAMADGDLIVIGSPPAVDDSVGADSTTVLSTEDADTAVVAESTSYPCIGGERSGWGDGCFQPHGDLIWVKDISNNNRSAYVYWQLYLRTSSGSWKLRRAGTCSSSSQTVGYWAECDYDFYEDTTLNAYGGKGSGVRVYVCQYGDGCSHDYVWVRNNG